LRVWFIPYGYLDGQRLVSQHNEVHGLTTVILNGKRWGSISDQFATSVDYLESIHQRCVDELALRAELSGRPVSPHPSSFKPYPPSFATTPFRLTKAMQRTDVEHLRAKWEAEGYFFGVGRLDLRVAESRLDMPLGRLVEDAALVRARTKAFVKANRPALKELGDVRLWEKLQKLGYQPS